MRKWHAQITRDFTETVTMGALMVQGREVAPARDLYVERLAGQNFQFKTKRERDAFIAATNADNPGAAEAS